MYRFRCYRTKSFPNHKIGLCGGKKVKTAKVLKITAFLAVIFICIGLLWFYNLDAPGSQKGASKAEPLLDAIQIYHKKNGRYPAFIQILVPEYIAKIPKPDWRNEYCYDLRDDQESFTLAFVPQGEALGDGWYVYSSKLDSWTSTDSDFWLPCTFFFDNR